MVPGHGPGTRAKCFALSATKSTHAEGQRLNPPARATVGRSQVRARNSLNRLLAAGMAEPVAGRFKLSPVETGLRGKRVLVTGASGGIGSACAREFAAEGSRVALHFHDGRDRAEALSQELGGAPIFGADLRSEDEVEELFRRSVEELGGLDVCAAVAGRWPEEDVPVWQLPLERWEETVRGNLTVTYLTARAFLREVEQMGMGTSS
jgi:hypothetical protein